MLGSGFDAGRSRGPRRDLDLARAVIEKDDVVDGFFSSVRNGLLQDIKKKSEAGGQLLDALMIAKYFERIGDHATNLSEKAVYYIEGEDIRHQ